MCNSRTTLPLSETSKSELPSSLRRRELLANSKKCHSSSPTSFIPHFELREKVQAASGNKKSSNNTNRGTNDVYKQPMKKSRAAFKATMDTNPNPTGSSCSLNSSEGQRTCKSSFEGPVESEYIGVEDVVAIIRNGVKQYHCLRKALLVYFIAAYFNFIASTGDTTIIDKTWHFFFNFLRFYPTLVGWVFLATKMKRIIFAEEGIINMYQYYQNPSKYRRGWSSTNKSINSIDTCDTYSSYMSTIAEETELEVELKEEYDHMDKCANTLRKSSEVCESSSPTSRQNRQNSSSWGYFADTISAPAMNGCETDTKRGSSISSTTRIDSQQHEDDDWGFFADIDDEEPIIGKQEKRPTRAYQKKTKSRSSPSSSMPIENFDALTKYVCEGFRIFAG